MLAIIENPDREKYEEITRAVEANGGYCPCAVAKTPETRCICREFMDMREVGSCRCGRFGKIELMEISDDEEEDAT